MSSCIGILLAGGQSSRMGQNKSQLQRQHQSMLEYSKQLLAETGVEKVIVSGEGHDIADSQPLLGPIGGIASVLSQVHCQAALIIPVDLPLMTAHVLTQLKQTGELSGCAVHFERHPLPLYLPTNGFTELFFSQTLQSAVNKQGKAPSIKALLKQVPHKQIACSNSITLTNTNTPEQWRHAQQTIQKQLRENIRSF